MKPAFTKFAHGATALAVLGALGWFVGCSDNPGGPCSLDCQTPEGVIVSNAVAPGALTAETGDALALAPSAVDDVTYVSLTPGTVPSGSRATVRRVGDPVSVTTAVTSGGFDPVAVAAQAGDSIEVVVTDAGGVVVLQQYALVAAARRPIIVRTDPPPRKRDVPLNASVVIVFSEPMNASTLTSSSVQLLRGTAPVAGTVRLLEGSATAAVFTPDAALDANTDYRLVVTQAVRDLGGDALAVESAVGFTTGTAVVGPVSWVSILPDSFALEALVGSYFQLTVIARDSLNLPVTGRPVSWASQNPAVATVSATGLVTAVAEGETRIEAQIDGQVGAVELLVSGELTPAATVTVTPTSARLALDGTLEVVAEIRDAAGAVLEGHRPITWTSSDPAVATVTPYYSRGATVAGVGVGSAKISAMVEGKSDTAIVTVVVPGTVVVSPAADSVVAGDTIILTATVRDPAGNPVDDPSVSWTSNSPDVATVAAGGTGNAGTAFGTVTGVSPGSTTITATYDVASGTASVTVPLGRIEVTVATSGADLPDMYGIALDSVVVNWVPINGVTTFSDVWPGPHTVDITGVAANCAVSGRPSVAVTVSAGSTANVAFVVTCAAFGAVQVTATTSGADADPDGYTVQVEGQPTQVLPPNGGMATFPQVAPGPRVVTLGGVRANCTVSGPASVMVTVPSGATASVGFDITCIQFMPTGSTIAFVRNGSGGSDVFLVTGESVPVNLTNSVGADGPPVWSPDGTKIAFVSQRNGNGEIYVMSADGSGQVNLTNNGAAESTPAWSPDGSRIAFVSDRDGNQEIYLMNADGSQPVNVTNNAARDAGPVWSADGARIAFVSDRDGNSEIYVMSPDGTGQVNLTNRAAADGSPAWSPDGRRIAFASGGIAVINADGTGFARLVTNSNPGCIIGPPLLSRTSGSPVWSSDGTVIAFQWTSTLRGIRFGACVGFGPRSGISVTSPDGSAQVVLVDDAVSGNGSPAWRPR